MTMFPMDKEWYAKFDQNIREIQKKAAQRDAALTAREEREKFNKMVEEERAKQDAKKRSFANPKTADEAEVAVPTIEKLANGDMLLASENGMLKTREEILEDGTLIEKIRLYFSSGDLGGYFGTKGKLTKEEVAKIAASIRTQEDKDILSKCYKEYNALKEYGRQLSFFFKRFQVSFSILAMLLNKWDSYERTAEQLTYLFNFNPNEENLSDIIDADKYPYEPALVHKDDIERFFSPEKIKAFLENRAKSLTFDGAELKADKEKFALVVDVFGDGDLYSQVKEAATETTKDLSEFKAYAVVAEEYIAASTLHFMPTSIQMSIENAEEERYARYLVKNLSFFRSELNYKKSEGITITPEDEAKAVIPDYYEVEPSMQVYKDAKKWLNKL